MPEGEVNPRQFANHPAERARKAVMRDASANSTELAAHLRTNDRHGTYCRYRSDGTAWDIDAGYGV